MRWWWAKGEPDRRREIGERLAQIFMQPVWTAELREEATALRDELLALDDVDVDAPPELPPPPRRRAVADPVADARRAVEREREAEAARWRRVVGARWGGGMSRVVYEPVRDAQRRRRREHTEALVRDGFRPWR